MSSGRLHVSAIIKPFVNQTMQIHAASNSVIGKHSHPLSKQWILDP